MKQSTVLAFRASITVPGLADVVEGPLCLTPEAAMDAAAEKAFSMLPFPHKVEFLSISTPPDPVLFPIPWGKLLPQQQQLSAGLNAKNVLQEYCMAKRLPLPTYKTIKCGGQDNAPEWNCTAEIPGHHRASMHGVKGCKRYVETLAATRICDSLGLAYKAPE
jgi:hypothetical protein